eukprot:5465077-Amphidinium_carterae.1
MWGRSFGATFPSVHMMEMTRDNWNVALWFSWSFASRQRLMDFVAQNVDAYLKGAPTNVVS